MYSGEVNSRRIFFSRGHARDYRAVARRLARDFHVCEFWSHAIYMFTINNVGQNNTCIRSSGLPVGSHGIVGTRAQKSGHQLTTPAILDYIEWE